MKFAQSKNKKITNPQPDNDEVMFSWITRLCKSRFNISSSVQFNTLRTLCLGGQENDVAWRHITCGINPISHAARWRRRRREKVSGQLDSRTENTSSWRDECLSESTLLCPPVNQLQAAPNQHRCQMKELKEWHDVAGKLFFLRENLWAALC